MDYSHLPPESLKSFLQDENLDKAINGVYSSVCGFASIWYVKVEIRFEGGSATSVP